jgi:hypothetical protein
MAEPPVPWRLLLTIASLLFVLHALLFRNWLIDDAGISLAYARNLAQGYGLTAQPGVPPVEGFSNPLWTLVLAGFAFGGARDALLTPKLLSLTLVCLAFLGIVASGWRQAAPGLAAALPLLLLPLNTSFVVWVTSGLENPLLVFLAVVSCALSLEAIRAEPGPSWLDAGSGLVSALLALTRPDAIVYTAAYPLILLTRTVLKGEWPGLPGRLGRYAAGFIPLVFAYFVFRVTYYHDWVPNTYHAKDKPSLQGLLDLAKVQSLVESAAGPLALAVVLLLGGGILLGRRAERPARLAVLMVYLGLATLVYLVMPTDWMGEYRFATAFFVFLYWALGEVLGSVLRLAAVAAPARLLVAAFAVLLTGSTALRHGARSLDFAAAPIVPFARVAAFSGTGYNRLAAVLGHPRPSLLTPDLGGTLFYSTMRVYDLAGLCDRVIAVALRNDRPTFLRYVFEQARPTFIHVHASWAEWADLSEDRRFARDYVAILERHEGPAQWRTTALPRVPWSGDYVRRDALGPDPSTLERLRRAFHELEMPALSP